jgi:hypothetical protein
MVWPAPANSIQVTVDHGLIVLTGEVTWQYQKKAAEPAARKLSGIIGVVNDITIKPCSSDIKQTIEGCFGSPRENRGGKDPSYR